MSKPTLDDDIDWQAGITNGERLLMFIIIVPWFVGVGAILNWIFDGILW